MLELENTLSTYLLDNCLLICLTNGLQAFSDRFEVRDVCIFKIFHCQQTLINFIVNIVKGGIHQAE
jgi:hypothetical protein